VLCTFLANFGIFAKYIFALITFLEIKTTGFESFSLVSKKFHGGDKENMSQ